ncbi:MAG TPA: GGDEF domain-containing protein [Rhodocyclaceae bacterium]|nr:GGDEF domain-containing protein [Rhodocyclaceae bacterium]
MKLKRTFLVLSILLALAMLTMMADRLVQAWKDVRKAGQGMEAVLLLQDMLVAVEMASRERGPANALLGSMPSEYPLRKENLQAARARTDAAFSALRDRVVGLEGRESRTHAAYVEALVRLQAGRAAIDAALGSRDADQIRAAIQKMFAVIGTLEPGILLMSNEARGATAAYADAVQGAVIAARLRENAGKLGSQFTVALTTRQPIRAQEHDDIQQLRGRIEQLREVLLWRISGLSDQPSIREARDTMLQRYFATALPFTRSIEAASLNRRPYPLDAAGFAAAYVPEMDSILKLRDELIQQAWADSQSALDQRKDEAVRMVGVGLLMLTVLGCTLWLLHARVIMPLTQGTELIVAIAQGRLGQSIPGSPFEDEVKELFDAIGVLRDNSRARLALEKERTQLIEQLRAQSNTDYLTGLSNRRGFYALAEHDLSNWQRHNFALTLAIFDVDHFKKVNDQHGHAVGDAVLVEIAALCQATLRRGDVAARFGGEEFLLWMPYCDLEQGIAKMETLRQSIQKLAIVLPQGGLLHVTASFGVVGWTVGYATIDQAITRADQYLYAAKSAGRNRVISGA